MDGDRNTQGGCSEEEQGQRPKQSGTQHVMEQVEQEEPSKESAGRKERNYDSLGIGGWEKFPERRNPLLPEVAGR